MQGLLKANVFDHLQILLDSQGLRANIIRNTRKDIDTGYDTVAALTSLEVFSKPLLRCRSKCSFILQSSLFMKASAHDLVSAWHGTNLGRSYISYLNIGNFLEPFDKVRNKYASYSRLPCFVGQNTRFVCCTARQE